MAKADQGTQIAESARAALFVALYQHSTQNVRLALLDRIVPIATGERQARKCDRPVVLL